MTPLEMTPEDLKRQLPYYLADNDRKLLLDELGAMSTGLARGYFIDRAFDPYQTEILQGDGWPGLCIYSFEANATREIKGIILSNSCDISPGNLRRVPPKLTFVPIVKLSALEDRLTRGGITSQQCNDYINSIRSQCNTSTFYLPADGPLEVEYVALLQDIHSFPVPQSIGSGVKLFTLSMAGFYLFIMKLSIHFCRLHEDVDRRPNAAL